MATPFGFTTYLKSSMDRFIARKKRKKISAWRDLKSSMDRFIELRGQSLNCIQTI